MAAYRERLDREDDPARLATMAEELPELPSFAAWADLGHARHHAAGLETEADASAEAETGRRGPRPRRVAETAESSMPRRSPSASARPARAVEDWYAPAEDAAESDETAEPPDNGVDAWGETPELQPDAPPMATERRPATTSRAGPPARCPKASRPATAKRPAIPSTAARSWPRSRPPLRPSSPPRPPPTPPRPPRPRPTSPRPPPSSSWAARPTSWTTTPRPRRRWPRASTRAATRPRRSASARQPHAGPRRGRGRRRAAHDAGRRVGSRVGREHRELQAPPRPPARRPGRRRRVRPRGRVRVQRHPPRRPLVPRRDPDDAGLRRPRHGSGDGTLHVAARDPEAEG